MGRPLFEIPAGITELIGADDAAIGAQDYSKSVEVDLAPADLFGTGSTEKISGEILNFLMVSSGGAIITPACWVYIFDADPAIASGDTDITLAEQKTIVGKFRIESGDWDAGAAAASAYVEIALSFHGVPQLYVALRTDSGSTEINSAGGDDEVFDFNFWYRRDDN